MSKIISVRSTSSRLSLLPKQTNTYISVTALILSTKTCWVTVNQSTHYHNIHSRVVIFGQDLLQLLCFIIVISGDALQGSKVDTKIVLSISVSLDDTIKPRSRPCIKHKEKMMVTLLQSHSHLTTLHLEMSTKGLAISTEASAPISTTAKTIL